MVIIHTNFGPIKIKLEAEKTPATVENFLAYARAGFYDGTLFHRVVENFVIQGGGFEPNMVQKPTNESVQNEAKTGLSNKTGTISMARTMAPHSATSQFFINVNDNLFLDHHAESRDGWGYCAFGTVIEGLDVAKKISQLPTHEVLGHDDVPADDVVILKVEVLDPA